MYGIDVLETEHKNIVAFTDDMEALALSIMEGGKVDTGDLRRRVDFIRKYCDKHHHQKEEDFLFAKMVEELGDLGVKLIRHGMEVEHGLARKHVLDLEGAIGDFDEDPSPINRLQIISYLMAYVHLLRDHAKKENQVIYPFALDHLSKEALAWVDEKTRQVEEGEGTKKVYQDFKEFICYQPPKL